MEHYYTNKKFVEEWFGYEGLYAEVVRRYPGGTFVELGSWRGRSTVFLGVEIINANSGGHAFAVDLWGGTVTPSNAIRDWEGDDGLYTQFLANIEPVKSVVTPIRSLIVDAALQFADHSVDFVFVDGGHKYSQVLADIRAWFPKVKPGGIFAGHDYYAMKKVRESDGVVVKTRVVYSVDAAFRRFFGPLGVSHMGSGEGDRNVWKDPWGGGCFMGIVDNGGIVPFAK